MMWNVVVVLFSSNDRMRDAADEVTYATYFDLFQLLQHRPGLSSFASVKREVTLISTKGVLNSLIHTSTYIPHHGSCMAGCFVLMFRLFQIID
jgi:hypothetical protein